MAERLVLFSVVELYILYYTLKISSGKCLYTCRSTLYRSSGIIHCTKIFIADLNR